MNKRGLLDRIVSNNVALAIIALIVASVIWLYIAVEKNVPTTVTFYELNVNAPALDTIEKTYGLHCYGLDNAESRVTVSGLKYVLGGKDFKENVMVNVDVSKIFEVGEYVIPVEATVGNSDSSTQIVSVIPDTVSLFFDRPMTAVFEPEITLKNADDFTVNGFTCGEPTTNVIKVTGPSSEVKKIEKIVANVELNRSLDDTVTYSADYNVVTVDGSSLKYSELDAGDRIDVTIPVYQINEFGMSVDFVNAPGEYDNFTSFRITPDTISAGFIPSSIDDVESVAIEIDYASLQPGMNTINVTSDEVEAYNGCLIDDEIEGFTVVIMTANVATKSVLITPENIEIKGGNGSVKGLAASAVTIAGPIAAVSEYESANIRLYADISDVKVEKGIVDIPLRLEDGSKCWLLRGGEYGEPVVTIEIE